MIITVSGISLPFMAPADEAFQKALKLLGRPSGIGTRDCYIAKKSLDARKKNDIRFVYSISLDVPEGFRSPNAPNIKTRESPPFKITPSERPQGPPPVVAGFGPAGMFAGLVLARAGLRPVILERGADVDTRAERVDLFLRTGKLDPESNVQFGEGGAGTFSDGKLTTRISDPLCAFVLEVLHSHGAPDEILYHAKPHIGTDKLRVIVKNIRREITALGGVVRFNTSLTSVKIKKGRLYGIETTCGSMPAPMLILAPGHSSRDLYHTLLRAGVVLAPKPFSVGVRIEHSQREIEKSLYGSLAGHPLLPKGEYQLSHKRGDRAVYTFCMCPGGVVVPAASGEGMLVTNGMSYHARNGENANSALVVSVGENDFGPGALDGALFQQRLERLAFAMGGGGFAAPVQTLNMFMLGKPGFSDGYIEPSYLRGVAPGAFDKLLPGFVCETLREGISAFGTRLRGFDDGNAVMTGVETRTSSPVRIRRKENMESISVEGLYPCGEGAGYAGGIISAAVDGIRAAASACGIEQAVRARSFPPRAFP